MIRVSPEAVVYSTRLPGSRTIWQTWSEVRGQIVPYVVESEDPAATELMVAAKLRTVLRAEVGNYSPRIEPDPIPGPMETPAQTSPPARPSPSMDAWVWLLGVAFGCLVLKACGL